MKLETYAFVLLYTILGGFLAESYGEVVLVDLRYWKTPVSELVAEGFDDVLVCYSLYNFLTDVNIPAGVKTLERGCFSACTSLKSISLPEGIETIGDMAFELCTNLEHIKIPSSVKTIGTRAFFSCYNLQPIEIPNTITSIGDYAFDAT